MDTCVVQTVMHAANARAADLPVRCKRCLSQALNAHLHLLPQQIDLKRAVLSAAESPFFCPRHLLAVTTPTYLEPAQAEGKFPPAALQQIVTTASRRRQQSWDAMHPRNQPDRVALPRPSPSSTVPRSVSRAMTPGLAARVVPRS